jgi:hypothetical protein
MALSEVEAVIRRYAKLSPNGFVIVCKPSQAELAGEQPMRADHGNTGKVVYLTRFNAELAAIALWKLGATDPQRVYRCARVTRKGHYHLTSAVGDVWCERWLRQRDKEASRQERAKCSSRSGVSGTPGPTSGAISGSGGLGVAGGCGSQSTTGRHRDRAWESGVPGATAYAGGTTASERSAGV